MNRVVDWVLFTSLFAACCTVGMCMATERLVLLYVPPLCSWLHAFVFGSTLVVYNIHYFIKKSTTGISDRYRWSLQNHFWHYLFLALGCLLCGVSIFYLSRQILICCIFLGLLSFAYSLPLLPFKEKKRLKDFGWIKILDLTGVWTIVTSVLPILYWERPLQDYPYEIVLRFVFMFTLCVAFDIRDMQTDLEAKIFTLPNLIGVKNSYRLMNVSLLFFAVLSIVQYMRYPVVERLVGELITVPCTYWAIRYTKTHATDRAYLVFVDGMMMVYAALLLLH